MNPNEELALRIAERIKSAIDNATSNGRISRATLHTQYGTNILIEAIADELGIGHSKMREWSGIGRPLAYFV